MKDLRSPHSEQATIGACIIAPTEALPRIAELQPEDFVNEAHQHILQALRGLQRDGLAIDTVTLCSRLDSMGVLKAAGGAAYINQLIDETPTWVNVADYAYEVKRLSQLRAIYTAAQAAMMEAADRGGDADAIRSALVRSVLADYEAGGVHTLFDALRDVRDQQRSLAAGEEIGGIDPILPTWRKITLFGRIPPGSLVVIGADPGVGKTMIALQVLLANALQGKRVAYIGNEMPLAYLGKRLAPILAHVGPLLSTGPRKLSYPELTNWALGFKGKDEAERRAAAQAAADHIDTLIGMVEQLIADRQLLILDEESDIDIALAKVAAEELRGGPFDLVVLDMIQGFTRADNTIQGETAMDNAVADVVTRWADRHQAVVLALSEFRKRDKHAPDKEDCRGSKRLIHRASFIGLLWIDEKMLEEESYHHAQPGMQAIIGDSPEFIRAAWRGTMMRVAKNSRHGDPTNTHEGKDIPLHILENTGVTVEILLAARGT